MDKQRERLIFHNQEIGVFPVELSQDVCDKSQQAGNAPTKGYTNGSSCLSMYRGLKVIPSAGLFYAKT